jgi:hypothetical protein
MYTKRNSRQRLRRVVATTVIIFIVILLWQSFRTINAPPQLAVRGFYQQDQLIVTWVQPGSFAWDDGIRHGQVVLSIDNDPVQSYADQDRLATADTITVRDQEHVLTTSLASSAQFRTLHQHLWFLWIATSTILVGISTFIRAPNLLAAATLLILTTSLAVTLIAATPGAYGAAWGLILTFVALVLMSTSMLGAFLVYPMNHLTTRAGKVVVTLGIVGSLSVLAGYGWVLAGNSSAYAIVRLTTTVVLVSHLLIGCGLISLSFIRTRHSHRRLLSVTLLVTTLASLGPFCTFTLIPDIIMGTYILPPTIAMTFVPLLPIGLGLAMIDREVKQLQRTVIRLSASGLLLAGLTAGMAMVVHSIAWAVFFGAVIFSLTQAYVWQLTEKVIFFKHYNSYAEQLDALADAINRVTLPPLHGYGSPDNLGPHAGLSDQSGEVDQVTLARLLGAPLMRPTDEPDQQ